MANPHRHRENIAVGLLGFIGELIRALQVSAMHGDSMLRVARGQARDGLFDLPHDSYKDQRCPNVSSHIELLRLGPEDI